MSRPSSIDAAGRLSAVAASTTARWSETFAVVGERWTLRIVFELYFGSRRFDVLVANTGVARNTLATRLRTLEETGVVTRCQYSDRPPRYEYHLTEAGEELIPAVLLLLFWGIRHLSDGSAESGSATLSGEAKLCDRPQRLAGLEGPWTTSSRRTDPHGACGVEA